MLDFVTKSEYFEWLDQRIGDRTNHSLKGIQDAWALSILWNKKNLNVAEIGGGKSRLLERLSKENECWNIDKFEGFGSGPVDIPQIPGVKVVRSYLGEFNPEIPDEYFDVIFSISVVEHIPRENLNDFFADCHRILKPGGVMLQAIDLYIFDDPAEGPRVIDIYRNAVESQGFIWLNSPEIDGNATFQCRYATNSDLTLNVWNRVAPVLKPIREVAQSVTIKLAAFKPPSEGTDVDRDFFVVPEFPSPTALTPAQAKEGGPRPEQITLSPHGSKSLEQLPSKPASAVSDSSASVAKPSSEPANHQPRKHKKAEKAQTERHSNSHAEIVNSEPDESSSIKLATSLIGRIVRYYSRWPVAVGAIAIGLNTTAFLLDEPFQWIFTASGTALLLFLVGHAASKADYVLDEVRRIQSKVDR